ncbi:MAG: heavy metal translocating P-type ATPase [Planctomycetota bacterium]|nr:MAG: heavy metal translocating P-type ATPase [Planctomycetota bacterium]RLS95602.1 MAG: heavy metal translocating P-type ATPase [Planctomycetota bacterium]
MDQKEEHAPFLSRFGDAASAALCGALLLAGFIAEKSDAPDFALLLFGGAYLAGGWEPMLEGSRALLKRRLDIDFLMVAAALGAASLGNYAEGGLLLFLFATGHALEHYALGRARSAVAALSKLAPDRARLRKDGTTTVVAASTLVIGDAIVVFPAERIAADGMVLEGATQVDQSPITGESMPVSKDVGDSVFAGTLNGDSQIVVRVTTAASETLVQRMVRLVADAQKSKSKAERSAEKFVRVYVPCVVATTLIAWILPPLVGWLDWNQSFLRAMSMLVGASPCALAISTPAAVLAGLARAARMGVLIKGGAHLEALGTIRAIAMDKTGTLTTGKPALAAVVTLDAVDESELLRFAAAVESASNHPIAQAVVAGARARNIEIPACSNASLIRGKGVEADVLGVRVVVGRPLLFATDGHPALHRSVFEAITTLEARALTVMVVVAGERTLGVLGVSDRPRAEARATVERLRAEGVRVVMLTGDNRATAQAIAKETSVEDFQSDLLPEHKIDSIRKLLATHQSVAMIGDGVNDAPALAAATVGIAMGRGGTDVALEAADVVLMSDDLLRIPDAIELGRAARSMVRQNVFIAMGVVFALIPLTLLGIVPLWLAVVFHEGSTVVVALNGLRLLAWRPTVTSTTQRASH